MLIQPRIRPTSALLQPHVGLTLARTSVIRTYVRSSALRQPRFDYNSYVHIDGEPDLFLYFVVLSLFLLSVEETRVSLDECYPTTCRKTRNAVQTPQD